MKFYNFTKVKGQSSMEHPIRLFQTQYLKYLSSIQILIKHMRWKLVYQDLGKLFQMSGVSEICKKITTYHLL